MEDVSAVPKREQKEVLLAIRMSWLHWLSTPIQLVWHVIVQVALAFWHLVIVAYTGLKGVYSKHSLMTGGVGGTIYFALVLFFAYIGGITQTPQIAAIGPVLGLLPLAWTYGEATSIAHFKRLNPNTTIEPGSLNKGNGFRVAATMILYVGVLVLALLFQALTSYLVAIPGIGPILFGIVLVPDVALSVLALVVVILFSFSLVVLPSHFLETDEKKEGNIFQRFFHLNRSLLGTLKDKWYWVQILIVLPMAVIFASIAAVPIFLLIMSSLGITTGLIGLVTAFSETAQQSLMGLSMMISGSTMGLESLPISVKIGLVLIVLSLSIVLGFALSPVFSGVPLIFHKLYSERRTTKAWPYFLLMIITILSGILLFSAVLALFSGITEWLSYMI